MSATVIRIEEAWRREMTARAASSIRLACVLGSLSFLGFAPVDPYLVTGDAVTQVWLARAIVVATLVVLLGLSWTTWFERHARLFSHLSCSAIGLGVIAVTSLVGGAATRYHEALLLTLFGFSLLPLPWRWLEAAACYLALILTYFGVMVSTGHTGTSADWWSTNAVLWAAVVIATALTRLAEDLRRADVASRLAVEETNNQLLDANARLKELDTAKNQFFANLSHELRTPLTLALAPIDALLEGAAELPPAVHDDLALARRSALRMLRLIDDLLALTRLESASLPASREPVDLVRLTAGLLEEVTPLARRKNMTLRWEPDVPHAWIIGDATWLERVVMNLLANALKFSSEGSDVRVQLSREGGFVRLSVSDDGPGIPTDQLQRVFERFHQVDGSATRRNPGMGIGLALARELVQLHGGTIQAESAPGTGTTMTVSLPATGGAPVVTPTVTGPRRAGGIGEWHQQLTETSDYRLLAIDDATERRILPRPADEQNRPTILVIEDNSDMIRLLGGLLGADYVVYTARDGESGLRMAHRRRPDLIVCDIMMPGMTGFDVVKSLRQSIDTRAVPVLMLTARSDLDAKLESLEHGADQYLSKPFRRSELLSTVRGMLRNRDVQVSTAERRGDERVDGLVRGVIKAIEPAIRRLAGTGADVSSLHSLNERLALLVPSARPTVDQVPVAEAIGAVLRQLPDTDARRVHVEIHGSRRALTTGGDLARVVYELVANALEAGPDDAIVRIVVRDEVDGVRVEVRDRGPGVTGSAQERIFHPFFTTRFRSPEAGLGLAIARSLTRRYGGTLTFEPNPGGGSVFTARFPSANTVAHPPGETPAEPR